MEKSDTPGKVIRFNRPNDPIEKIACEYGEQKNRSPRKAEPVVAVVLAVLALLAGTLIVGIFSGMSTSLKTIALPHRN